MFAQRTDMNGTGPYGYVFGLAAFASLLHQSGPCKLVLDPPVTVLR